MEYNKILNNSILIMILGISCLIIGFAIGKQTHLPFSGIEEVSASQTSDIPDNNTGF